MKIEPRKYSLENTHPISEYLYLKRGNDYLFCPFKENVNEKCGEHCPAFQIEPGHKEDNFTNEVLPKKIIVDYPTTVKLTCFPQLTEFTIEEE